jgi:hypothetical protein
VGEPPAQPLLPAPGAGAEGNLDCVAWLVASALARDLLVWAKDLFPSPAMASMQRLPLSSSWADGALTVSTARQRPRAHWRLPGAYLTLAQCEISLRCSHIYDIST